MSCLEDGCIVLNGDNVPLMKSHLPVLGGGWGDMAQRDAIDEEGSVNLSDLTHILASCSHGRLTPDKALDARPRHSVQ